MDRDLVEAARNGDREAYVDLIRVRTDRLFAIAQRILRDIDRAEDALQDALVIAWRDLKGLRDPDRFDAWLQRLLINVCIAQATRERRRTANLRVLPVDDGPAAPDDLLSIGDRDQLDRGFRRLPPEQRAILVLHHFLGYAAVRDRRDARHPARHGPITTPSRTSRHAGRPRGGRSDHGQGRSIGMTQQRDIERLLDHWFADGSSVAPDRVIDIVADRIERQPQRPAWRLDWRHLTMNPLAKAGVAIAAVVLVALRRLQPVAGGIDRRRRARPIGEPDRQSRRPLRRPRRPLPIAQRRLSGLVHAGGRQPRSRDPVCRQSDDPVLHARLHIQRAGGLGQHR